MGGGVVTELSAALGLFAVLALARYLMRWRTRLQRAQDERSQALAMAHTWGVVAAPGESTEALLQRVSSVALQGNTSDPIETAARALRNQRERRAAGSSANLRSAKRA